MSYISPGFPASGGDSAPLLVEPGGRIDVLYQGYQITNPTPYTMNPPYNYFTSSVDGGATWPTPVAADPHAGTMSLSERWNDCHSWMHAAGTLPPTWRAQA